MKILVLGSTGKLGTAVETVCQNRNISCVGLTHADIEITNPDEVRAIIEKKDPDIIVNAAGLVGITQCELEPQKAFNVNTIAINNLAKICNEKNITLVYIGTVGVFDGKKDGYYTEEDTPNPTNVYAISKYAGECFVKNICKNYYIIRLPTLFGKRRNKSLGFVDKVHMWLKQGKELRIADDKVDSFAYTIDAANALISILEKKMPYGIYHIANSGGASYYDFVSKLIEILKTGTKIIKTKDKYFKSEGYKPLKTPTKSIKLEPLRSWQDALYDYLKGNEGNK